MQSFKVNCVLISSILLWASAFIGIKLALVAYSPGALALFRFLIASACMYLLYRRQRCEVKIPWYECIQLMSVGMAGIGIYNICLNYGELTVSAGIASFIIGLMPVITVLLSLIVLKERINNGTWAGIILSMVGLLLLAVAEGQQQGMSQGIIFVLIASFVGSFQTIMKKRFLQRYGSIRVISWVIWGGTTLLLIYTPDLLSEFPQASYQATAVVIYMGIFPAAVAYSAWAYVLKKIPAAKASISLYTLPLTSTLLGMIVLSEHPSMTSLLGGGIALVGAFFANRFQNKTLAADVVDKKAMVV